MTEALPELLSQGGAEILPICSSVKMFSFDAELLGTEIVRYMFSINYPLKCINSMYLNLGIDI